VAALARIGSRDTAVSRLGLSADEQRARDLVGEWLSKRGAEVRRDAAANLFARFGDEGETILVGSHLDSVPEGGRFDGALGVLCAVEALESLVEAKTKLRRSVEVVAWADEEGARFGVGLFGSTAAFGRLGRAAGGRADRSRPLGLSRNGGRDQGPSGREERRPGRMCFLSGPACGAGSRWPRA